MEDILTEGEKILQQQLTEWVYSITTWEGNAELISPEFVFVNYSDEHLFSLIIKAKEMEKEMKMVETMRLSYNIVRTSLLRPPVLISLC